LHEEISNKDLEPPLILHRVRGIPSNSH